MQFEPTAESVKTHVVPEWYNNAKFGIFIHWGLYSVPAFAVTKYDIIENLRHGGWNEHFKNNPYAEWYCNTLKIKDSPTQQYHEKTFGKDFPYSKFADIFEENLKHWNPMEWAQLIRDSGAKYTVITTKHHDGFLLWPSDHNNPNNPNFHVKRDILGDLSREIRNVGVKFGVYYSGQLDWSWDPRPIIDTSTMIDNGSVSKSYIEYANSHIKELIEKYKPSVLWNDIGYPPNTNVYDLFAHYYNSVEDGVINDRWIQTPNFIRKFVRLPLIRSIVSSIAKKMFIKGTTNMPTKMHSDFLTPEYSSFPEIQKKKWESTRGIGKSFGFNQFETDIDYLSAKDMIWFLIDIVSKNGNLLLNIGPKADGTIPESQKIRLLAIGKWLATNGKGIYSSFPWKWAEGETISGMPIRFTQTESAFYIFLKDLPQKTRIDIPSMQLESNSVISLMGGPKISWKQNGNILEMNLPTDFRSENAIGFEITPKPEM